MKDLFDKNIEIFASRDKIRKSLLDYCKLYLDLTEADISKSSYLSYLINVLSVLASNLIFYNSSVYREFFLTRARQRESVINLSNMLGYTPNLAISATVPVLVTIPIGELGGISGTIMINGYSSVGKEPLRVVAGDDIIFLSKNTVQVETIFTSTIGEKNKKVSKFSVARIIAMDESGQVQEIPYNIITIDDSEVLAFTIEMIQADVIYEMFYVPTLEPYQFYTHTIPLENAFLSDIKVYSSNITEEEFYKRQNVEGMDNWEYTSSLFLLSPEEKYYTYRLTERELKLIFGNNIIGKQPNIKDLFVVILQATKGSKGNVISGAINTSSSLQKVNINGTTLDVNVSFVNLSSATGGSDYPTLEEVRKSAIAHVRSHNRLVSSSDYQDIKQLSPSLPIRYSIPILKRSDLKCNEVCLYTDLIYDNSIVPTRNEIVLIEDDDYSDVLRLRRYSELSCRDFSGSYFLEMAIGSNNLVRCSLPGDKTTVMEGTITHTYDIEEELIEKENVVSAFDIELDKKSKECRYYYVVDNNKCVPKLNVSNFDTLFIQPTTLMLTRQTDDVISIDLTCSVLDYSYIGYFNFEDGTASNILCEISLEGTPNTYYLYFDSSSSGADSIVFTNRKIKTEQELRTYPTLSKYCYDYPDDQVRFNIRLKFTSDNNKVMYSEWSVDTIIKKNLTKFMYSPVDRVKSLICNNRYFWRIYEVPSFSSSFVEHLKANGEIEKFENLVIHELISFRPEKMKMLTDFVNVKFSTATGLLTNMLQYNKLSRRETIIAIDPDELPNCPSDNDAIAITSYEKSKRWLSDYNIPKTLTGYLLKYSDTLGDWVGPLILKPNDILLYKPYLVSGFETKLIYNGYKLVNLIESIPLKIVVDVWIDANKLTGGEYKKTEKTSITDEIKQAIIYQLAENFGYDTSISVVQIQEAVKSVRGVKRCVVVKPNHDIFYNFALEDLNQDQLLRYTPQLLYVVSSGISVNIREE